MSQLLQNLNDNWILKTREIAAYLLDSFQKYCKFGMISRIDNFTMLFSLVILLLAIGNH